MLNADNGPENSGARTQWLKRLIEFSATHQVKVQLACYPPYHSKYNPIERVFGVLENYWNGDPLLTVDHALGMAGQMTYKGVHPTTQLIDLPYQKGVRLDKQEMKPYERCLDRLKDLGKWFITIVSDKASATVAEVASLS